MNPDMFTPTLDWGNELWTSLWWIAKAWAIAAVSTLVILVLIGRFTTWGKQFWRITGAYFTGPASVKVWLWLGVLLLSVIIGVRIDVLLSYYGNDMMTSFQVIAAGLGNGNEAVKNSGKAGFWLSMLVFAVLATIYVAQVMLDLFLMQRFMLRWRAWLTDRPVTPDEPLEFLKTVILGEHLARLPEGERDPFARAVYQRIGARFTAHYVRLNIDATTTRKPGR